jgi:CelD/BcsL family acetyltransferase involved in cellulose biosynthesis
MGYLKNQGVGAYPDASTGSAVQIVVSTVTTDSGFEALRPEWTGLLGRTPGANPFLSHEWLFSWWKSYRPQARLMILLARRGADLVGIAPLMLQHTRLMALPLRTVRFVGDGTWETDHMNVLVDSTCQQAVLLAFCRQLDTVGWDVLELNQLPQQSPVTSDLLSLIGCRWPVVRIEEVACPFALLPDTADDVMKRLPSRMRSSLRASQRRLATDHTLCFGEHGQEGNLADGLAALYGNHASRWEAKGQDGVFVDSRKRELYERVSRLFLERGWLRFYYLRLDDKVVAQQFCFEYGNRVMLLQEGFDFALAKENVGNLLRLMVFEHLAAQGGKIYDFLAGTSRHKATWSTGTDVDLRVLCVKRSLRGHLYRRARAVMSYLRALRPAKAPADSGPRPEASA